MKKILTLLIAVSFLIFGGACFTPALYDKPAEQTRHFVEVVNTFLITQDGKNLIVAGKQHHYIFTPNDTLKFILAWPERKRVKVTFNNFSITSDQTVLGSYQLRIDNADNLTNETLKQLSLKGFTRSASLPLFLTYYGQIQGTRYLADKFQLPAAMQFSRTYSISMIEHQPSATEAMKRILLTPLAVAADGLLILGGVPILIFSLMLD